MKKLLGIVVLGLLLSTNVYSENITIKCIDEKRDVQLILNFDEGGDWINFNGRSKEVSGRKDDALGVETTIIEITKDKIDYFQSVESIDSHMVIIINRFDGSMYQYGKLEGKKYDYNYMCEKTDRKF